MFHSEGSLHVELEQQKIIVSVDRGIGDYYYRMIPYHFVARRPLYTDKITVVRTGKETICFTETGKFEGRPIKFSYDGVIRLDPPYFYLDVWSEDIEKVRRELGLPKFRAGFKTYHMTVGNIKR
jgi:hypothetical protein